MPTYFTPEQVDKAIGADSDANKGIVLGPLFVAEDRTNALQLLDVFFMAMICVMAFRFFNTGERGWTEERVVIGSTSLLAVATSIWSICYTYDLFVLEFGSYWLIFTTKYQTAYMFFTPIQLAICQIHLARKAFILYGRNWYILGVLNFMTALMIAGAVYFFCAILRNGNAFLRVGPAMKIGHKVWLGSQIAADLGITITIALYLWRQRSASHMSGTNKMLAKLVRLVCQTQSIPPLLALVQIGSSKLRYTLMLTCGKIYILGLLYAISVRESLKHDAPKVHTLASYHSDAYSDPIMMTGHATAASKEKLIAGSRVGNADIELGRMSSTQASSTDDKQEEVDSRPQLPSF